MKERDVKKELKKDWREIAPDERVKNETRRALFGAEAREYKIAASPVSSKKNRRWVIGAAMAVIVAIVVTSLVLWLPRDGQSDVGGNNGNGTHTPVTVAYASEYGFSAMSSGIMLLKHDKSASGNIVTAAQSLLFGGYDDGETEVYGYGNGNGIGNGSGAGSGADMTDDEAAALINEYMELVESVLAGGGYEVKQYVSDREGYEVMLLTEMRDLEGHSSAMRLYYNETLYEVDDDEREYRLSGVMELNGTEYSVEGTRNVEPEEGEEEMEFVARSRDGVTVKVELECEADEQEYEYTVYDVNGEVIDSFSIEAERDDGRTEVELLIGADRATGIKFYESEHPGGGRMMHGLMACNGTQRRFSVCVRKNANGVAQYEYTIGDAEIVLDKDDIFDDFDDFDDLYDEDDD